MPSFLVTGGAGFIGSHLVEALVRRGERVRVVDNLVTGKRENLARVPEAEFVEADLVDLEVVRRAVEGCDYVLHQAAIPSVPRSVEQPVLTHRANVDGTLNVLVAARDAGVRRVVLAGSSSVFGNAPGLPKREDMPTRPMTPYALQKLIGEQYAAIFASLYGLETVTLRYFNVFGPRQDPSSPYSGVISRFVNALTSDHRPTIYGDGEQTRDFTYVANIVEGVLRACEAPGVSGEVIQVATGGRVSINQLFRTLQGIMESTVEPVYGPPRPGDVHHSQADIEKARSLLGYSPTVSFEEGLRRTVRWYQAERATLRAQAGPS